MRLGSKFFNRQPTADNAEPRYSGRYTINPAPSKDPSQGPTYSQVARGATNSQVPSTAHSRAPSTPAPLRAPLRAPSGPNVGFSKSIRFSSQKLYQQQQHFGYQYHHYHDHHDHQQQYHQYHDQYEQYSDQSQREYSGFSRERNDNQSYREPSIGLNWHQTFHIDAQQGNSLTSRYACIMDVVRKYYKPYENTLPSEEFEAYYAALEQSKGVIKLSDIAYVFKDYKKGEGKKLKNALKSGNDVTFELSKVFYHVSKPWDRIGDKHWQCDCRDWLSTSVCMHVLIVLLAVEGPQHYKLANIVSEPIQRISARVCKLTHDVTGACVVFCDSLYCVCGVYMPVSSI